MFVPGSVGVAQTDFVYPNSNVQQIDSQRVTGSASKLCGLLIFNWGTPDVVLLNKAIDKAKSKAGADLLINANYSSSIFSIPPLFSVCSAEATGYPATMEIGKQELR